MNAPSEHRVLLDLEHSNNERLRVTISPFKGRNYIHVRKWWQKNGTGEWLPGKGIGISERQLSEVIAALQKAAKGVP